MDIIITETQLRKVISEQTQSPNLTYDEQALLGFLNRMLQGERGEFENMPDKDATKNLNFNSRTIYPMALKLLEKKRTGKKTYDDKEYNALMYSMEKNIKPGQKDAFNIDGGKITNITYSSKY